MTMDGASWVASQLQGGAMGDCPPVPAAIVPAVGCDVVDDDVCAGVCGGLDDFSPAFRASVAELLASVTGLAASVDRLLVCEKIAREKLMEVVDGAE